MLELGTHDDLGITFAMIYVAWADGALAQTELALIAQEAADQGLDGDELAMLKDALLSRPSAADVAALLSTIDARKAALYAAHATVWADQRVELVELDALTELAAAFGLSASDHNEVSTAARRTMEQARAGAWAPALLVEEIAKS